MNSVALISDQVETQFQYQRAFVGSNPVLCGSAPKTIYHNNKLNELGINALVSLVPFKLSYQGQTLQAKDTDDAVVKMSKLHD